jgi:hypothetical protein
MYFLGGYSLNQAHRIFPLTLSNLLYTIHTMIFFIYYKVGGMFL